MFHHAGGSSGAFRPLAGLVTAGWRVAAIDLPGRLGTSPYRTDMIRDELLMRLAALVIAHTAGKVALFGHSMGGRVAFEMTRMLQAAGCPVELLVMSACPEPSRNGFKRWLDMPASALVTVLRDLGGTPEDVLAHPEMAEFITGTFRADLALLDGWALSEDATVTCPTSLLYGEQDPTCGADDARFWAGRCRGASEIRSWAGGHFYLFDDPRGVSAFISERLSREFRYDGGPVSAAVPAAREVPGAHDRESARW